MSPSVRNGAKSLLSRQEGAIFLLLLVSYVYFLPRYADWSQSSRTALILAIVNDHRLEIDRYGSMTGDYAEFNGHRYSDKAPGTALLGVPAYAAAKLFLDTPVGDRLIDRLAQSDALRSTIKPDEAPRDKVEFAFAQTVATWAVVSIPAAILGVCLYRALAQVTGSTVIRLMVTLGYALCTSAFPYAGALYSHQMAAALLFISTVLLWKQTRPTPWRLVVIGVFLGLSLISEYPTALIVGGIGLYALSYTRRISTAIWIGIGALTPLAIMAAHNQLIFGTLAPVGYEYSALWQEEHQTGFFSLSTPSLEAIWGITFSLYRGIFLISPILLVGMVGLVLMLLRPSLRREALLCAWCVLSFIAFNSTSVMWSGGFGVGPRYLVPTLPFLAVGIAVAIDRWRGNVAFRVLIAVLLAWSFIATWSLTIGGQSFPTYDQFPLRNISWPALAEGNIARNLGTFLGLKGWASVLPLAAVSAIMLMLLRPSARRNPQRPEQEALASSRDAAPVVVRV